MGGLHPAWWVYMMTCGRGGYNWVVTVLWTASPHHPRLAHQMESAGKEGNTDIHVEYQLLWNRCMNRNKEELSLDR